MKIESKIGTILQPDKKIFDFVSNFKNFQNLIPADKVKNWESTEEECSFEVEGLGKTGMKIIEKEASKLVKITSSDTSPFHFFLWIQLKQLAENDTRVKITIEPKINAMMQMMVKKPLQTFVDTLVDQMVTFSYDKS